MTMLSEEITIPSPPDETWPLLRDPAVVASRIPGATLWDVHIDDVIPSRQYPACITTRREGRFRGLLRVRAVDTPRQG